MLFLDEDFNLFQKNFYSHLEFSLRKIQSHPEFEVNSFEVRKFIH